MVWAVSNLGQRVAGTSVPPYDTNTRWPLCLRDILSAARLGREKYCHVTAFLPFQKAGLALSTCSLAKRQLFAPRQALLSWDKDAREGGRPPGCRLPRGGCGGVAGRVPAIVVYILISRNLWHWFSLNAGSLPAAFSPCPDHARHSSCCVRSPPSPFYFIVI